MYLFWYIPFIIYNIMSDKVKYGSNLLDYKKIEDEFATHLSKWLEWEDIAPERQQNIRKMATSFLQSWKQNGVMDPIAQTYTGNLDGNSEDISEVLRFVSEAISGRGVDYFKYQEPEKPKEEEKSIAQIKQEEQKEQKEYLQAKTAAIETGDEFKNLLKNYSDYNNSRINKIKTELKNLDVSEKEIIQTSKDVAKDVKKDIVEGINNNLKLSELDQYDFTESDWYRVGSLAADLVSIFDPEPISAGILGLVSDGCTLYADELDGTNDSYWDDVSGVGLSLLGTIPGLGDAGLAYKITRNLSKASSLLGKIFAVPAVASLVATFPELKPTYTKLINGKFNELNVTDLQNLHTVLLTGLGLKNTFNKLRDYNSAQNFKNMFGKEKIQIEGTYKGKNIKRTVPDSYQDAFKNNDYEKIKQYSTRTGIIPEYNWKLSWKNRQSWYKPYYKNYKYNTYIDFNTNNTGWNNLGRGSKYILNTKQALKEDIESWKKRYRNNSTSNTANSLSVTEIMEDGLFKQGGILKAQNGTPLWFTNRYKSKSLKGWSPDLNKDLWIKGGIRGKADSLEQPWNTNYAYSQDTAALQNDLSNFYKNSVLDEQKALEEYNSNVNKLNNFWGNTDVYYNQTVDINPVFDKLYTSRHSDNPNYGLGYQQNLDTILGSTTWNRRALAYENDQNQAFDFGTRKVAFNKDGTIRFVDDIQSVPEVQNPEELQNPETQNVKTHSYSNKNKDEEIPKLQKAPKNGIYAGEILAKLSQYTNYSIHNKKILDTSNKTPLYQMILPPNVAKKIYGNQRAIEEAQKAKGELKSEASKAKTSDANLEVARQFQANYQGNQYLAQGFKEDDAMYRKTEAERQQQDEKDAMLNWQTVNQNLKYLNDQQQGKIKAKVDYLASQRESRDNLLKALETIYMNNRYDKQSKQEAAYNEYIKNYALRYPSATGLKEADIDILRKTTRTDQEEKYYQEYILPTLQSWIQSQKYGSIYYPNLPINKPGYYEVHS